MLNGEVEMGKLNLALFYVVLTFPQIPVSSLADYCQWSIWEGDWESLINCLTSVYPYDLGTSQNMDFPNWPLKQKGKLDKYPMRSQNSEEQRSGTFWEVMVS